MTSAADEIRARRALSNAAIAARDAAAVVAIMTDDVTVAVAGGPVLSGREASRLAFAEQMGEPGFRGYVRTADVVEVAPDGCLATERGRWVGRWQVGRRVQEQHGSYVATWRRVGLAWCIASERFIGADGLLQRRCLEIGAVLTLLPASSGQQRQRSQKNRKPNRPLLPPRLLKRWFTIVL